MVRTIKKKHETSNARVSWRDCRNGRIIRIHLRNSDLLHQKQPADAKTSSFKQACMFMLSM